MLRIQGQRTIEARGRFSRTSQRRQHVASIAEQHRIAGIQCDSAVMGLQSLFETPQRLKHSGQVGQYTKGRRIDRNGALIVGDCLLQSAQIPQGIAPIVVSVGEIGLAGNGAAIAHKRFLESAELLERVCTIVVGKRETGIQPDRLIVLPYGVNESQGLLQRIGLLKQGLGSLAGERLSRAWAITAIHAGKVDQ